MQTVGAIPSIMLQNNKEKVKNYPNWESTLSFWRWDMSSAWKECSIPPSTGYNPPPPPDPTHEKKKGDYPQN